MTRSVNRKLKQQALYWEAPKTDMDGNLIPGTPQVLKCRWEEKFSQIIGKDNVMEMASGTVWVNDDLNLYGYLQLIDGDPDDALAMADDIPSNDCARKIIAINNIPNRTGSFFVKRIYVA